MKVFTALMATETNTFCPIPTALEDFDYGIGEESLLGDYFKAFRKAAEARGWDVQHGPGYWAPPAGTVIRSAYMTIKADLLKAIGNAMPMDALVLGLHGAMYTDGYPDTEGDFLKAVRDLVGPDMPIGVKFRTIGRTAYRSFIHALVRTVDGAVKNNGALVADGFHDFYHRQDHLPGVYAPDPQFGKGRIGQGCGNVQGGAEANPG